MDNEPLDGYGYWDNHPTYDIKEWQDEAFNGDTRLGYWEWVKKRMED